ELQYYSLPLLSPIVLFLMIGFAQKLILNIYPRATKTSNIPVFNEIISLTKPINNCTTAPPIIPVIKIPAKAPWCLLTEFSAKDMMTGYMTERKNPQI